jgi:large subunit ribosomal protein L3
MLGLIGKKCGMTRIFTDAGESIPVTVIEVQPNRVVQVKNKDNDGYYAIQVTTGQKKTSHLTKAMTGHYAKAQVEAGTGLWEFVLEDAKSAEAFAPGALVKVDIFKAGDIVDVQGVSKGKGFAGVIKRHHFNSQDASHGNSLSHRAPGSIGQRQTPGRVFKGKKMAGHLGAVNRTARNQEVVRIDSERNLILVKGGVPGAPGGYVVINLSRV